VKSRAGLTLVELVVVLVILVLVAGTALTATEGLVGETRYETTRAELRNIEKALLGSFDASSSGEEAAIAFVADIGRLPVARGDVPEALLSELWIRPETVSAFAIQSPAGDLEVRLPGGWRGPYVRVPLGLGETALRDGWGREYDLLAADGTVATQGTPIGILRSRGADRELGGIDYDADLTLVVSSTAPLSIVGPRHTGAVPVRVTNTGAAGGFVVVRIYGPVDGRIVTLGEQSGSAGGDALFLFDEIPVGPRVVRAYRTDVVPETPQAPFEIDDLRSPIRAITVVQGGIPELELEIP